MTTRTARVGTLDVISAGLASIVQIGDAARFTPAVRALAVQREITHEQAGDATFAAYPVFRLAAPPEAAPVAWPEEAPAGTAFLHRGDIRVDAIHVISVTAASMIQAGNTGYVNAESRLKHIRQFGSAPPGGR